MAAQSTEQQGNSSVRTLAKPKIVIILILICVVATFILFLGGFNWYIVAIPIAILISIFIIGGYTSPLFDWTGFGTVKIKTSKATEYTATPKKTTTREFQPSKTLWDWMQLLIVPIVLVLVVSSFNAQQNQINQRLSDQQHQLDLQNQQSQAQATELETYLDRMSDLLFTYNLHSSKPGDEVSRVADARTFTALQSVDGNQKGVIIRFLYAADLITAVPKSYSIVSLGSANLMEAVLTKDSMDHVDLHDTFMNQADLRSAILNNSNLSITIFDNANLSQAYLRFTDLHWSSFIQTKLVQTVLTGANLGGAILIKADLRGANLVGSDLSCYISPYDHIISQCVDLTGAELSCYINSNDPTTRQCVNLTKANLTGANLSGADLSQAILSGADLSCYINPTYPTTRQCVDLTRANLTGADLSNANLTGAIVTSQQLSEAKSLSGTIMPNGSLHP